MKKVIEKGHDARQFDVCRGQQLCRRELISYLYSIYIALGTRFPDEPSVNVF